MNDAQILARNLAVATGGIVQVSEEEIVSVWLAKTRAKRAELLSTAEKRNDDLRRWLPDGWPLPDSDAGVKKEYLAAIDHGGSAIDEVAAPRLDPGLQQSAGDQVFPQP